MLEILVLAILSIQFLDIISDHEYSPSTSSQMGIFMGVMWDRIFCRWTVFIMWSCCSICLALFLSPAQESLHFPCILSKFLMPLNMVLFKDLSSSSLLWPPWRAKILLFNSLFLKLGMSWSLYGSQRGPIPVLHVPLLSLPAPCMSQVGPLIYTLARGLVIWPMISSASSSAVAPNLGRG